MPGNDALMRAAWRFLLGSTLVGAAAAAGAESSFLTTVGIDTADAYRSATVGPAASPVSVSDTDTHGASFSGGTGTVRSDVIAGADRGRVGAYSETQIVLPGGAGGGESIDANSAFASMDIDDFVISGPAGPVTYSLNLEILGDVSAAVLGSTMTATAAIFISASATTSFGPCTVDVGSVYWCAVGGSFPQCSPTGVTATGVFVGHPDGGVLTATSPDCQANVGESIAVHVEAHADSGAVAYQGGPVGAFAHGTSDFGASVRFPFSGPVFNLPAGYSVNSTDGYVLDNRYYPAPEPDAAPLAGAALGALVGIARGGASLRRRRRRCYERPVAAAARPSIVMLSATTWCGISARERRTSRGSRSASRVGAGPPRSRRNNLTRK